MCVLCTSSHGYNVGPLATATDALLVVVLLFVAVVV
jgi:hypothetical protein